MKSLLLALLIASPTIGTGHAQTLYHCIKAGKKVFTDQPCETQGATQQKRVDYEELPPVNTSRSLTSNEINRAQQIGQRLNAERQADEQQRQQLIVQAAEQEKSNQWACSQLEAQKKRVISRQRQFSTDSLNAEHKRINDEMYDRKCKTL